MVKKISRREFLRLSTIAAAGGVLAACAQPTPEKVIETVVVEKEGETVIETVEVEKEVEKVITATPEPPVEMATFPGVALELIMRRSFIPEMNTLQENQIAQWAESVEASAEASFAREWREMTAAAIEAEAGGDIAELFQNTAHVYAEKLEDVSDICEALGEKYGPWYDAAHQCAVVDGVWRAIPRAYTAHAINYRVDHFTEVGYPDGCQTYDEYLDAATKLKEAGLPLVGNTVSQTGPNDSASWCYSVLWSFGGREVEEDGKTVALNTAETRKAIEWMKALSEVSSPDITGYDEGGNNRAFMAGEISATQNATSIYWNSIRQVPEVAEAMSHFKYPEGPAGRHQFIEMNLLSLFSFSQNTDAAKALLAWLMEPEQLSPLAQVGLTFYTPMLEWYDDQPSMPWNVDPKLAPLKGLAKTGHLAGWPGPTSRQSGEAYANQTLVNMFASVIAGDDIETAVARAEEELKTVYEA
jgi:multiple sugar transport system substrate-binding protein